MHHKALMFALVIGVAALAGCGDDNGHSSSGKGSTTGSGAGGGGGEGGGEPLPPPPPISEKATVKLKTKQRLLKDVGNALGLSQTELCKEVGSQLCSDVHSIALGGVDAYGAGVFVPLKSSAVTTPIAVDRLMLYACSRRAHLDFKDLASAVIFKGLDVSSDKLVDVDASSVGDVITTLFNRVHLREPTAEEIGHLRQLYSDIDAGGSSKPAQDWSALSCYSVLTMMESVFY